MRLVAFCEAAADFRIASDLVDRVLRDKGAPWVGDVFDEQPEAIRSWRPDGEGRAFFDVHKLRRYVDAFGARVPHGHFDGRPGAADALLGRQAFAIVRALMKRQESIDAVVV